MPKTPPLKIGANGFATDDENRMRTEYVDSFVTAELVFAEISVIAFRLYDGAEGGKAAQRIERAHQFRMSPERARKLGQALIEDADKIEGAGEPRQ